LNTKEKAMFLDTILDTFRKPPSRQGSGKARARPAKVRQTSPAPPDLPRPALRHDAVVIALVAASFRSGQRGAALTVSELAAAMGCSVGESSKRVKAAADAQIVAVRRDGRRKLVQLGTLDPAAYQGLRGALSPGLMMRHLQCAA
jgi:hypothetical protein